MKKKPSAGREPCLEFGDRASFLLACRQVRRRSHLDESCSPSRLRGEQVSEAERVALEDATERKPDRLLDVRDDEAALAKFVNASRGR